LTNIQQEADNPDISLVFAVPDLDKFSNLPEENAPGRLIVKQEEIILNQKKSAVILTVSNKADRPIQVFIKKGKKVVDSRSTFMLISYQKNKGRRGSAFNDKLA
jgi:hypothetical protein